MAIGLLGFGFDCCVPRPRSQMVQFLIPARILQERQGFILAAAFVTIARGYPESAASHDRADVHSLDLACLWDRPCPDGWWNMWAGVWFFAGVLPIPYRSQLARCSAAWFAVHSEAVITSARLPARCAACDRNGSVHLPLSQVAQQFPWAKAAESVLTVPDFADAAERFFRKARCVGSPCCRWEFSPRAAGFCVLWNRSIHSHCQWRARCVDANPVWLSVTALGWTAAGWAIERARHSASSRQRSMNFIELASRFQLVESWRPRDAAVQHSAFLAFRLVGR